MLTTDSWRYVPSLSSTRAVVRVARCVACCVACCAACCIACCIALASLAVQRAQGASTPAPASESAAVDPMDWPNWRGPHQDNTSRETGLVDSWDPAGGPEGNLLWKNAELAGRSTPIVLRGRLYTLVRDQPGTANEGEKVVCADAATGEILWQHRFNVYLSDVPDTPHRLVLVRRRSPDGANLRAGRQRLFLLS